MQETAAPDRAPAYTMDLRYPSAFVFGQTPVQLVWAAAASGARSPSLTSAFRYCDLGCGDGITLNVLADQYPDASFVGIDLNAEHLQIARTMAERGGLSNVSYLQSSFTGLATAELESFDFIAIHGVYSWVDDEVRAAIHDFVRNRLKPGGLVCVQYSCLPGSTVHDPLLNALGSLAEHEPGDSAQRVRSALGSLRKLVPASLFFKQNPLAVELVKSMTGNTLDTLAHDVLNRRLHSFYFHEVRDSFAGQGLEFVGSGNLKLNHPELMLPGPAYAIYRELTHGAPETLRQELLDLMVNTESRCDVFRRADAEADSTGGESGFAGIGDLFLQPVPAAASDEARRRAAQGTAIDLGSPLHRDLLALIGGGTGTIREVLAAPALNRYVRSDVERAIAQLYMLRCIDVLVRQPGAPEYRSDRTYRLASSLNRLLLEETILVTEPVAFASPVLGTALRIPPDSRLWLLVFLGGDLQPIWEAFGRERRRILDPRGNPISNFEVFRRETEASLPAFVNSAVPELLRFGLLEPAD